MDNVNVVISRSYAQSLYNLLDQMPQAKGLEQKKAIVEIMEAIVKALEESK